jgi:hypothetical protein
MFDFIRPEVRFVVWRYRDALIGAIVSIFGIGWAMSSVGFIVILGLSVSVAGALLMFAGIQRGRFQRGHDGVGVVSVDEGQVTYFGPFQGGTLHVDDLVQIDLDPGAEAGGTDETPSWLLLSRASGPLRIPLDATGSEKLFDVFTKLKGIRIGNVVEQVQQMPSHQVVIWRRNSTAAD